MPRIVPFFWFDTQAEEAANFYCSIFPNSKIRHVGRYGEGGPGPKGSVMMVVFELDGQEFRALNGGPMFKFNESVSLTIDCDTQQEIDYYWEKLTGNGGQESRCGWLKDRFGLSWQITPRQIGELIGNPDPQKSKRAVQAMLKMKKLDINELRRAAEGN